MGLSALDFSLNGNRLLS